MVLFSGHPPTIIIVPTFSYPPTNPMVLFFLPPTNNYNRTQLSAIHQQIQCSYFLGHKTNNYNHPNLQLSINKSNGLIFLGHPQAIIIVPTFSYPSTNPMVLISWPSSNNYNCPNIQLSSNKSNGPNFFGHPPTIMIVPTYSYPSTNPMVIFLVILQQ